METNGIQILPLSTNLLIVVVSTDVRIDFVLFKQIL